MPTLIGFFLKILGEMMTCSTSIGHIVMFVDKQNVIKMLVKQKSVLGQDTELALRGQPVHKTFPRGINKV